jgi:hypothetical protein
MEDGLRPDTEDQRGRCLRYPVRDGRHAEQPGASPRLGYLHCPHRGRKVRPRRHPVPDLVKVVLQVGLEVGDGLPVHPGGTTICLDLPPRLHHQALRYAKRFPVRT